MAETVLIQPDAAFIERLRQSGGDDLKKCFQCATCSATCDLAPDDAPFPRRQMLHAQWGLRDRLIADPAIWLCHACGECTRRCPRGARPGDVIGAVRRETIREFAWPASVGRAVASASALPFLLLLPAILFTLIALTSPATAGEAPEFAQWFPARVLEPLFFAVAGLALVAFALGIGRFVHALAAAGVPPPTIAALGAALVEIARHGRFSRCKPSTLQRWGHLLTFWSFIGLAVVGTIIGLGTMFGLMHTPLAVTHPLKVFANAAAIGIGAGGLLLLIARAGNAERRAHSTYFDWLFLLTLIGVAVTGVSAELLRLGQVVPLMFAVYWVHLVLVFSLFLYAPYTKFAHLAYRTVAIAATMPRTSKNVFIHERGGS
jgi:quinone-modifying oxidoreductase subunit QmoC